ncbi:endothelial differentiation-related factor 1 isoform X1 [Theropithecus gelada]|uniref:Endothelial differentiation related factor 1 n=1 Tax=Theropithecus gelada TaxID=9565 RepID=A0A8D2EI05_THEGE|nr:endothelial differentiation-related factor 1 isoform X1 [Theropithecus gelada]
MAESDWDTVTVLRKKGPTAAQAKSKQAILAAQRRGEDVETSKKWAAGQNKQHSITKNTAKLDRETEELHHDRVTLEVGKVIQQGRQSKGLTQKDLATVRLRRLSLLLGLWAWAGVAGVQIARGGQAPPPWCPCRECLGKPGQPGSHCLLHKMQLCVGAYPRGPRSWCSQATLRAWFRSSASGADVYKAHVLFRKSMRSHR